MILWYIMIWSMILWFEVWYYDLKYDILCIVNNVINIFRNIIGRGLPKFGKYAEERLKKRTTQLATTDLLQLEEKQPVWYHMNMNI
jgi:hypothetical protein